MSSLYGFAFQRRNISTRTLYSLNSIDHRTLLWGEVSIDRYINKLLEVQPDYILGLGIFFSRKCENIWIETHCSDKFRRNPETTVLPISPYLKETDILKYSNHIGYSYCNYVSYRIVKEIFNKNLNSKYTFIHIPKNFDLTLAKDEITKSLNLSDII